MDVGVDGGTDAVTLGPKVPEGAKVVLVRLELGVDSGIEVVAFEPKLPEGV